MRGASGYRKFPDRNLRTVSDSECRQGRRGCCRHLVSGHQGGVGLVWSSFLGVSPRYDRRDHRHVSPDVLDFHRSMATASRLSEDSTRCPRCQ